MISCAAMAALLLCGPLRADDKARPVDLKSSDGQFELKLPEGWAARDFHVEQAQIGAANDHHADYLELIVDPVSDYIDSLKDFAAGKCLAIANGLDDSEVIGGKSVKIGDLDAFRYEIHGKLPGSGVKIAYIMTAIKDKKNYIEIIAWTPESRFHHNQDEMTDLATGFSDSADSKH